MTRAQDGSLAGRLNTVSYINRTLAWDAELEAIVAGLTPAEISAALVQAHRAGEDQLSSRPGTSRRRRRRK